MKNVITQFEKRARFRLCVKVSKNGNEFKPLNPKLKALFSDIVMGYEKDGTLLQ